MIGVENVSKLYDKYIELKKENNEKMYLFKSGLFYVFLEEDAVKISKITTLKCTQLTPKVVKCGFPQNSLERYLEIFKELNLEVEVIQLEESEKKKLSNKICSGKIKSINELKSLDLNAITPIRALELLYTIKKEVEENE